MLKKITTNQVVLGMYIQSFDGHWLRHPFWKSKFLLSEQADLTALHGSDVPGVWIDVSKGLDVPAQTVAVAEVAKPAVVAKPAPARSTAPVAAAEEMKQAAQALNRSKQAVYSLFSDARMGKAVEMDDCLTVVQDISASVMRNSSALISLARLKNKDEYTYLHSVSVCALMVALSRELKLSDEDTRQAGVAGLLHDVGKMLVPDQILNKPGKLTDDEFSVMRLHPARGHEVLLRTDGMPDGALDVCLHHHEKFDGSGYPHKLSGEGISILSRMGAVCDVYDAITSNRPYKEAWRAADSLSRMAQWVGHFDPQVFHAFVRTVGIYPVGTLVKLQSGHLAVVIDQNANNLTHPMVRVFFSLKSNERIAPYVLDLAKGDAAQQRILGREDPVTWGFTHMDALWRP